jgi:hypothetical protein
MKRILFSALILLFTSVAFAQPIIDIGLKAGVNASNLHIEEGHLLDDNGMTLSSESFTKMHFGAFGRIGWSRIYIQPEVYFSTKGGNLSSNIFELTSDFDYSNVDVPLLFGLKLIKGSALDLHVMAGPVFSFVTDANYPSELDPFLHDEFFNEHLFGVQYGLGVDVLFLTVDARMEHSSKIYDDPSVVSGKATTFMLTVGFKIL